MDDKPTRTPPSYAHSGKIMLSSVVILFAVILTIILFHIYARWFFHRSRRLRRRLRHTNSTTAVNTSQGLDLTLLKSLPTFVYSSKTHASILECAVCLSDFENTESGRVLPVCNHCFHVDCIDTWFHSHSNCPLCRSPVSHRIGDVTVCNSSFPAPDMVSILVEDPGRGRSSEPDNPTESGLK